MNFHTKLFGGLASVVMITTATFAMAEVTAKNAHSVLTGMQNFGLVATMGADNDGDPKISSRVSDTKFSVYFYGCSDNINCASIMIKAGYDLTTGITASKVNEWNRKKRFAKAYIDDEGDPFLELDVNLSLDGVGNDNFEDTLDWWRLSIENFEEFIDW